MSYEKVLEADENMGGHLELLQAKEPQHGLHHYHPNNKECTSTERSSKLQYIGDMGGVLKISLYYVKAMITQLHVDLEDL